MLDWISGIAEGIAGLGESIVSGIRDVLVSIFVPSEDFVTDKWNSIKERFSFANSISETADTIITFFKDTAFDEPPKVHINLDFAESKYDYGGETYCLDMSWYARYKPTVDAFLSAWLWLTFIWRVYTRLPGIINGASSDFQTVSKVYEQRRGGKK